MNPITHDSRLTTHDSRLTIHEILKNSWGYNSFRPLQEEIIQSVLQGNDTLALMPTGGGKSICYQVPALAKEGLCLVISPLIALMKDQVENLRRKNITAYAIYSGMSRKEVINVLQVAAKSNCKFLYVSPERLETSLFKEYLPGFNINLVAVDEAHCISQWGYDFRPSYLKIASLREELTGIPVLALTASATPEVQEDICDKLQFKKKIILRQSFERSNLSYSVFKLDSKINKLIEILRNVEGSAIVYCKSRKKTQEISDLLKMHSFSADFYHAGLKQDERSRKQEEWIGNKTRVIVCTNAFGMGIDKPDVRTVVHADVPDCLENYYQEAGRAGRDGKKSYAVLLNDEKDLKDLQEMTDIRFPSIVDIRNVYQAISNYLQIPSESAEGVYYDFDLNDFIKKFKLNSRTVIYSLKALEHEGWLSFNEQVFLPPAVQFTTNKDYLYDFEKENSSLEPLIKNLLRAYEGIFDYPASISELWLCRLLNKDEDETKTQLSLLHEAGIIDYRPQKDEPQILLLRNRIKSSDLFIDMKLYNERKEKFKIRVLQINSYIKEYAECRSRIIGIYFGDANIKNCGICDNCLRQKNTIISKVEFENINHLIVNAIQSEHLDAKNLLLKLKGIKKEKAWKVIDHLQAENKIELDKSGWLRLK